jgi:hypothetical protein
MKVRFTVTGTEPITLTEMKNYLRVDYSDDDDLITSLITAAREVIEKYCGISIVEKTVNLVWPAYEPILQVPYGPVQSYTTLTIDDEDVDEPEDNTLREDAGELVMEYVAGYDTVPQAIISAIKELTAIYYGNRGTHVEMPKHLKIILEIYNRNLFL